MEQQQRQQQKQGGRGFAAVQNGGGTKDEDLELPPGFRFHPTDEELVTHYLTKKVLDGGFACRAIGDVDLNKCEPWDLPWRAKMGENEWYFFCVRDRKYPTGLRTNRATEAGYWKATGKDKEIHRVKLLVGMKKTLVFYRGRAPKGEKTNWVMHEYRKEGKSLSSLHNLHKTAKNEWVICRVFKKSSCVKKVFGDDVALPHFPPLLDSTYAGVPASAAAAATASEVAHVSCFSNVMEGYVNTQHFSAAHPNDHPSSALDIISKLAFSASHLPGSIGLGPGCKLERELLSLSQDTGLTSDVNTEISSVFANSHEMGRQRLEPGVLPSPTPEDCCLWNY